MDVYAEPSNVLLLLSMYIPLFHASCSETVCREGGIAQGSCFQSRASCCRLSAPCSTDPSFGFFPAQILALTE